MVPNCQAGLRGQKWISLSNVLEELCEWDWIEKKQSEDAANVIIYQLLDKGLEAVNSIKQLEENSSPLKKLDTFHGVISDY